jgi:diaminohydroxyphosphoribosylaminopyrimidine deaminase/5-amino-6-(5-phosphoribosylamino)uracil reductase
MSRERDRVYMARAIRLAAAGLYTTHPNPRVGCVLVRRDEIVGEGWHRRAGEAHAERNALAAAGARAEGATAFVSLEPCCHQGRTPPCTLGLIEAGVRRVVAAMRDPNPLVSGQGLALLERAGVAVECGLLEDQARALNPGFVKRMARGLPYVRNKLAMSLDGRTAMASGESKWISSEAARADVQRLRARSEAVVTGIGTVLADDPSLNVRLAPEQLLGAQAPDDVIQPVRVVLDSRLRMPPRARMLALPGQTLVLCVDQDPAHAAALEAAGARVYRAPESQGQVDLEAAFRYLAEQDINEVLLECGPTLAGSALQAGLVDELVIYVAPHLMGDMARGLFSLPALRHMHQRMELEITEVRAVGRDWRITARPAGRDRASGAVPA